MGWFTSSSNRRSSSSRPAYSRAGSERSSASHSRSSSYYKRRPRDGYISRLVYKLKHLIHQLWYYARKNPIKIFFLVIMPLISGGVLAGIARQFGIRLPSFLQGKGGRGAGGGSGGYYGSHGYEGGHGMGGAMGGLSGLSGLASGGNMGSLMSVAKAFL